MQQILKEYFETLLAKLTNTGVQLAMRWEKKYGIKVYETMFFSTRRTICHYSDISTCYINNETVEMTTELCRLDFYRCSQTGVAKKQFPIPQNYKYFTKEGVLLLYHFMPVPCSMEYSKKVLCLCETTDGKYWLDRHKIGECKHKQTAAALAPRTKAIMLKKIQQLKELMQQHHKFLLF